MAYKLLSQISLDDVPIFDMDPDMSSPVDLLLTCLPVPPCSIRPSVESNEKESEDDLTTKMGQIIRFNNEIMRVTAQGLSPSKLAEACLRL